ncbi:MAG TPA: response regulator [Polyangiaceae bacterium]
MKRTPSGTRPRGHIVLIVGGDSEARSTLATLLASAGFGVLESADGPESLKAARAARPDVILLDLSRPDIGFEDARRLRSDRETRHIPLIGLPDRQVDAEVLFERLSAVLSRTDRRHTA